MATILSCDVCKTVVDEGQGFEVQNTSYVVDRSDRDADSRTSNQLVCSRECLKELEVPTAKIVERFSEKEKAKATAKGSGD